MKVSTIAEMNNVGKCFEYTDWPRERKSGEKGYCAPIAAYYIASDLSRNVIEHIMKTQLHDELTISESRSVFVTDGTCNIVDVMNSRMPTTFFRRIYPSIDVTSRHRFSNSVFGDTENSGKFLMELRDEIVQTAIGISHYVSFDTEKL